MQKMTATDKKVRELRGDEPNFGAMSHVTTDFSIQYVKALNWVHYNVDESELKAELTKCLQDRKADQLVPFVGDLDGVTFSTLGKIAYCINRGADLAPTSVLRIRNALEKVRDAHTQDTQVTDTGMEVLEQTAAGRVNEIYKACYSRIDNVKARVLAGKTTLDKVQDEVRAVLDAQGAKAQVRKRLVEHYTQSLQEALADKTIKTWVKPLQQIVTTLGGDVKQIKEKVAKVATKEKVVATKAKAKTVKGTKEKVAKAKPAKTVTNRSTKTITIKVPTVKQETAQPSVAHQVRELIRVNKKTTDEQGMIEIVIHKLGLSKERGRSVVKAFWNKVEV